MILTSVEAQNRFGQLLDTAQREPITITRRGRPIAVLVAIQDYVAMQQESEARTGALVTGRNAIAAFRGSGHKGTVTLLLADRRAELNAEADLSPGSPSKRSHA